MPYDPNDPYGTQPETPVGTIWDGVANRPDGSVYYPGPAAGMPPLYPQPPSQPNSQWDPNAGVWTTPAPNSGPGPLPPPQTTGPPPPPPPGGGSSGGGNSYDSSGFQWPQFHAPALPTINPLVAPAPFSYEAYVAPDPYQAFSAPTLADAENEPGYAFAREQGIKALENSKAAQGTLRTGGTLKDILAWGNRFGEQNYGNVYNRATNTYTTNRDTWGQNELARAQSYDRNRANAQGIYDTNWGTTKDVYGADVDLKFGLYDRDFQGKLAEFNPQFRGAELQFADLYNRWRDSLNATTQVATAGAGR